jgi:hypothetical protein
MKSKPRTKNTNRLTFNSEIARLAYALHLSADGVKRELMEVNIPNAYRMSLLRLCQRFTTQAQSLGKELNPPSPGIFINRERTESYCDQLGLF